MKKRSNSVTAGRAQLTDAQWRFLTDQPLPENFDTFVLENEFAEQQRRTMETSS
jgi:hypothetical protein